MSHQQVVVKIDNTYGKTKLCSSAEEADSHVGRRIPWCIIETVLIERATVHWQGIKLVPVLDPPNSIEDTPEFQREQVRLQATRDLLQSE